MSEQSCTGPLMRCAGLGKRYGKHWVLSDLSLELGEGEVFGLLGPNGAGKTTLIRILLGLAAPSAGEVEIFGLDLFSRRREILRQVGAVVEAPVFFEYLSAWDNLRHLVALSGGAPVARINEVLDLVGLHSSIHRRVGTFSYGMKQRLGIAQAMLPQSKFLILDEPTNGLDPHGIAGIRELVRRLSTEQKITVLVSSHMLGEIEQVCDRVAIIHRGRKVLEEGIDQLRTVDRRVKLLVRSADSLDAVLQQEPLHDALERVAPMADDWLELELKMDDHGAAPLVAALVHGGIAVEEVRPYRRSLEDIFLETTKEGMDDVGIDSVRI